MLLAAYLGGFAVAQATSTYRKLTDTTVELANLTSQFTSMQVSDAQGVLAAAAQIMTPYDTTQLSEVLSLVATDANNTPTVTWSQGYPNSATPLTKGASVALPANLAKPNTTYILVQTRFNYNPVVGAAYVSVIPMKEQIIILPRQSTSIPCSTC
jgi:Flp pilus assembly protein TadG